jgi:hypothetical protein
MSASRGYPTFGMGAGANYELVETRRLVVERRCSKLP